MITHIKTPQFQPQRNHGFTLVELLITMAISGFIMAAIYTAYTVNQRHNTNQTQVIEMQQNIRAALYIMLNEIRMAGYDPTGSSGAGFDVATIGQMRFTKDITDDALGTVDDGDGDTNDLNEDIIFGFDPADDPDADGILNGGGVEPLKVSFDGGVNYHAIADNIESLELSYTLEGAGGVTTMTTTPTAAELDDIVSVTISLLARSSNADPKFTNSITYNTGSGATWVAPGDNFRRRLLVTNVKCRNMGLL